MSKLLPRLMVAAASSGSGKTTVTCALLRALKQRGLRVASFKCGPDYIDPMFHRECVGVSFSSNLDLFLGDERTACALLAKRAPDADFALVEGVMGYYDGIASTTDASSYALSAATGTPVLLVVNCRGMAASVAAQVKGFLAFRENSGIVAVLLNRISAALYPELKALVEGECGVPVAGYLPPLEECTLESRHLGLVTAFEIDGLQKKLDTLAAQAERTVDIDLLLRLALDAKSLNFTVGAPHAPATARIAVARDAAFCFYYEDSLALLEQLGAQLLPFSPLEDETLPEGADGLLLGGGYPELYAARLSRNTSMRECVRAAVAGGLPTVAECGGFLYLHASLENAQGVPHPMAGVLDAKGFKTGKLSRFGYARLTAREDNLLCAAGEALHVHEFHYWDSTAPGAGFHARKPARKAEWNCVHATGTLWAGFPHLYFPGCPDAARRFLKAAVDYRKEQNQ